MNVTLEPRRPALWRLGLVARVVLALVAGGADGAQVQAQAVGRPPATPRAFIENLGQWPLPALFAARLGGMTVRLEPGAIAYYLPGGPPGHGRRAVVLRVNIVGAKATAAVRGEQQVPGIISVFLGNDPARWRSRVPAYRSVLYEGIFPDIDLRVSTEGERLGLDVLVGPAGDPNAIRFAVEGARSVYVDTHAALVVDTEVGTLVQPAPRIWRRTADGGLAPVAVSPQPATAGGCAAPGEPAAEPVTTAGPGLAWSTFLGGDAGGEAVYDVAVAPDGTIVVAGDTDSFDFPVTPGAYDTTYDAPDPQFPSDSFVSRLSADGSTLLASTYLGGTENDLMQGVGTTAENEIMVVIETFSPEYPLTPNALFTTGDVAVSRFAPDGTAVLFSTRFGGSSLAAPEASAFAPDGTVAIAGYTGSLDYPTTPGAFDTTNQGAPVASDAFVAHIDTVQPALLASSLFGGSISDYGRGVAVDPQGRVVLVGDGNSPDLPVTNNLGSAFFVARFDAQLTTLDFLTTLGGHESVTPQDVAVDPSGSPTIVGFTSFGGVPVTPGAFDTTFFGLDDAFVLRLDPTGSVVEWATYLGSGQIDHARKVAVDAAGITTLIGYSRSDLFPTTPGAFMTSKPLGSPDVDDFVARFSPDGSALWYSTLLGGTSGESNNESSEGGMCLAPNGDVLAVGTTFSSDFPVTDGAHDTSLGGGWDGYVTRLTLLPLGVERFGTSTPGCDGPLLAGVTSMPQLGSPSFGITCTGAPPLNSAGMLVLGVAPSTVPMTAKGAQVWVSLGQPYLLLPAASNGMGLCVFTTPIPNDALLAGVTVYGQFVWKDACPPAALAASDAREITIQP